MEWLLGRRLASLVHPSLKGAPSYLIYNLSYFSAGMLIYCLSQLSCCSNQLILLFYPPFQRFSTFFQFQALPNQFKLHIFKNFSLGPTYPQMKFLSQFSWKSFFVVLHVNGTSRHHYTFLSTNPLLTHRETLGAL